MLAKREINTEKFAKYFIIMGLAVAAIAAVQYFMQDRINLFPGLPKDLINDNIFERNATYRITIGHLVIPVAAVIAFARYRQCRNLFYLFSTILLLSELVIIQQTRTKIAAVFLSMVVVYVLSSRLTAMRISVYIIFTGLILTSSLFLTASDFYSISLVNRTKTDIEKRKGSYRPALMRTRIIGMRY